MISQLQLEIFVNHGLLHISSPNCQLSNSA